MVNNYYNTLGVTQSATPEDIKKAFRKLVKIWHPDACKEPNASEMFVSIAEAYEILKDPLKKRQYDDRMKTSHHQTTDSGTSSAQSKAKDQTQAKPKHKTTTNNQHATDHNAAYRKAQDDAYRAAKQAARKKAEAYANGPIEDVLKDIMTDMMSIVCDMGKYILVGDKKAPTINLVQKINIGVKACALVIAFILTCDYIGVLAAIPVSIVILKRLYYNGRFTGLWNIIKYGFIMALTAAILTFGLTSLITITL